MEVTRTAIVYSDYKNRFKEKNDAIKFAKELNGKLCSLRYIGKYMECTFGFGVYIDDTLIGAPENEYKWI